MYAALSMVLAGVFFIRLGSNKCRVGQGFALGLVKVGSMSGTARSKDFALDSPSRRLSSLYRKTRTIYIHITHFSLEHSQWLSMTGKLHADMQ